MTEVKTNRDKLWNLQYEKLVEFKRKNGDCLVPQGYKEDKTFGMWVNTQRKSHKTREMRQDRKDLLNELGFVWTVDLPVWKAGMVAARVYGHDKRWHQQYEKLVELERKNGKCIVPTKKYDACLSTWVRTQRTNHTNNKMRQDRKELLDEIGFVWRVAPLAARRSPTMDDVRCLVIGSFHALFRCLFSLSFFFCV
jgi:hypothetical protein